MKHFNIFHVIIICILFLPLLGACNKRPTSTADIPHRITSKFKVAVLPFMQPKNPAHMISGQLPDVQGHIPENSLTALNESLRTILTQQTNRAYEFLPTTVLTQILPNTYTSVQPAALNRWLAYGKEHDYRYILIPQVIDWQERQGSGAGVTTSAYVKLEFYLVNTAYGTYEKSVFEEKQTGLVNNLLTIGDFFKRKGRWVTALELSEDGIRKAVKDLGL